MNIDSQELNSLDHARGEHWNFHAQLYCVRNDCMAVHGASWSPISTYGEDTTYGLCVEHDISIQALGAGVINDDEGENKKERPH